MFDFIKKNLKKIYHQFANKIDVLCSRNIIDSAALKELEIILIEADTGTRTTKYIIKHLQAKNQHNDDSTFKEKLSDILIKMLTIKKPLSPTNIYLMVGVNGSGKTTFSAKLAQMESAKKKQVLLVAADTFRAAASEQLACWAQSTHVDIVTGKNKSDPASVVFTACHRFNNEKYDSLIVDTAGRLQTNRNLMGELKKIKRVLAQQLPGHTITTLLTIDAMLGQNSLEQVRLFHESIKLNGIVLTKMDGTGKGGIVFAIAHQLKIPISYISFGEQVTDFNKFNAHDYVQELLK